MKGCLCPHQHRCDHKRQLAQHGDPRWLHGTRTAQEHLGSVVPVDIAMGSSGCLREKQNGDGVGVEWIFPEFRDGAAAGIPVRVGTRNPLGEEQRQPWGSQRGSKRGQSGEVVILWLR